MPQVSVIVPCYDVAQYIQKCLECLTGQTLHDIEIICIDDMSGDDTLGHLRKYAAGDERIHIIQNPKNTGVATARNIGIEYATGEYIGFVDPDDTVDTDFFATLYSITKRDNADIAKATVRHIDTNGVTDYENNNAHVNADKFNFRRGFWSAIYRREFINAHRIRFPDGQLIGEDLFFLLQAVYFAKTISTTDDVAYHYYRHAGSLDSNVLGTQKLTSATDGIRRVLNWANTREDMTPYVYEHVLDNIYNTAFYLASKDIAATDKQTLCDTIIWIHQNSANKNYINKINRSGVAAALRNGDANALARHIFARKTRLRLFGLIPLIKTIRHDNEFIYVRLMDIIPVATVRKCSGRTKISVCGIPILTIKR